MMRKAGWNKFLACLLVLSMIAGFFGMVTPQTAWAEEDPVVLTITGTGLEQDVIIHESYWEEHKTEMVERYYSSNNTWSFHKITKAKGYDLFSLIGEANLKTDQDYTVTFECLDTFKTHRTVSELKNAYYYSDFTEASGQIVAPMIDFYKAELISLGQEVFNPPVDWQSQDRELTESDLDDHRPRAVFGQQSIDDTNQSGWARDLVRIVVGEERPVVITIDGNGVATETGFTIAQLKAMPAAYQIDEDYQYNSSSGSKTVHVKGVDLCYILQDVVGIANQDADVQFINSDADTYPIDPQKQEDIKNPSLKYVLAYEVDGEAYDGINKELRIYRKLKTENEFNTVFKNIIGIRIDGSEDIDFTTSPYKHITYTNEGNPYNIDDITTATLTIEGPGVENYRAISVPQIEEANDGLFRGTYAESIAGEAKQNTYEGITVSYLLDNFVTLTSDAQTVIFKDKSGNDIGEYTLDEVRKTDYLNNTTEANNLQMIVAYGVNELPLVYSNTDVGYDADKGNDNGPFKLVVGQATADEQAVEFSRVNKIYVTKSESHYEHDQVPYNNPDLTNYLVTITGSGLGHEKNYSVADLEAMIDIQYEDRYSLSNSENYWYYNDYKGVKLWDLLLDAGLDASIDENTTVQFIAADNYAFQPKTIKDIKDASQYGYYQKDPADLGDGSFDGSNIQPEKTGCPVLLAYGFNGYPYVSRPADEGYIAGIGNDGGPLRIISGKKDYNDTNGSNQVQFAKKIIIGNDADYCIHSYAPYDTDAASPVTVKVVDDNDTLLKQEDWTVKDIEDMVYAVAEAEADKARVKDSYFVKEYNGNKICDLYEGVGIWYLLSEQVGLPGTTGTVTFKDSSGVMETVTLEDIRNANYNNEVTDAENMKPVLAFAKNGYPMVVDRDAAGYAEHNDGGPLGVIFGQTTTATPGLIMSNVQEITVKIQTDEWAHLTSPYNTYGTQTLTIHGDGARTSKTLTVNEVEALQNYIMTDDYYLAKSSTEGYSDIYRGINLYEYLRQEVGLQATASGVTIVASDEFSKTFTLEEIAKADYINTDNNANDLKVMLAYGKNNLPLVPGSESDGYSSDAHNKGGPLQLIIGQKDNTDFDNSGNCIKDVVEIIIEAEEGTSWKHDHGLYSEYQDQAVLRVTGSEVKEPRTFTLKQLEALNDHIIRSTYTGDGLHDLEGVILWNLINNVVELKDGVTTPSSIRVFSGSNYNQIISDIDQVMYGKENSQGVIKDIILAYATDGYPLVPETDSTGYEDGNQFGPLRLVVEENNSMWVKWTDCIVVGTGDYEAPVLEAADTVFTLTGDGIDTPIGYTMDALKGMTATTASYLHKSVDEAESCTGVLLSTLLTEAGITGTDLEIKITTTDGFEDIPMGACLTVPIAEISSDDYLVTYEVEGVEIDDVDDDGNHSSIRIYRNYDDGTSTWYNRCTNVIGIGVIAPVVDNVFTISGDGIDTPIGYTMDALKGMTATTASYLHKSVDEAESCTGVLLSTLLADAGITRTDLEIKITTTDGFEDIPMGACLTVPIGEISSDDYLVTYEVEGVEIDDVDDDGNHSSIRIYRNYDDGTSTWYNRCTNVTGISVIAPQEGVFINTVKLLNPFGQEITSVSNQGCYRIQAVVNNNTEQAQNALIIIQVRNGEGATAIAGGHVLECMGLESAIPTTGSQLTAEFTMSDDVDGESFVDVFVWDGWDSQVPLASAAQGLSFDINE